MLKTLAVVLVLSAPPPPPPSTHFEYPNAAEARFSFHCPGRTAAIVVGYSVRFTETGSVITVTRLQNGGYRLTHDALAEASDRLAELHDVKGVSLQCAGGGPLIHLAFQGSIRSVDGVYTSKTISVLVDGSTVLKRPERR